MEPIVLFGIQFTLSLVAYSLLASWYVAPRLSGMPRELALAPLLWVHAFRIVGGTILAPGAVGLGVPMAFRTMIGYGDLMTALLALLALTALRARLPRAIALVWLSVTVGMLDTVNAIIQSMRFNVFTYALYESGQYAEVIDRGRERIEATQYPEPLYNLACCESLTGRTSDAVEHLRLALDRTQRYRERLRWLAANDSDFDPIRNEPAFRELTDH
jgi:hypothetical protein